MTLGYHDRNCPINEMTADGVRVGRCWFYLQNGKICPRHGNVNKAVKRYKETGRLTDEVDALVEQATKV